MAGVREELATGLGHGEVARASHEEGETAYRETGSCKGRESASQR
jgi:hypothetical protein